VARCYYFYGFFFSFSCRAFPDFFISRLPSLLNPLSSNSIPPLAKCTRFFSPPRTHESGFLISSPVSLHLRLFKGGKSDDCRETSARNFYRSHFFLSPINFLGSLSPSHPTPRFLYESVLSEKKSTMGGPREEPFPPLFFMASSSSPSFFLSSPSKLSSFFPRNDEAQKVSRQVQKLKAPLTKNLFFVFPHLPFFSDLCLDSLPF